MPKELSEEEKIEMIEKDSHLITSIFPRSKKIWSKFFSKIQYDILNSSLQVTLNDDIDELSAENLIEAVHSGFSLLEADPRIISNMPEDQLRRLFDTPNYIELPAGSDISPKFQDEYLINSVSDMANKVGAFSIRASTFFLCKEMSPIVDSIKKSQKIVLTREELTDIIKDLVIKGFYDNLFFDNLGIYISASEIMLEQI